MKMKDIFTPEDFEIAPTVFGDKYMAAKIANEKLNTLIKTWTVIYGPSQYGQWSRYRSEFSIHKGMVAFISDLKDEPCIHEPIEYEINGQTTQGLVIGPKTTETTSSVLLGTRCRYCNVELVAEWKEKPIV